ncbi:unnamed protein product [Nezara viridula]|uniref:Uncharacterized protein n=1 Tax=Nezara viridula TaxID=85310 RepID=A0A9P0E606_NEZVI|nr:unnamed protein product [Nezara viridula]
MKYNVIPSFYIKGIIRTEEGKYYINATYT